MIVKQETDRGDSLARIVNAYNVISKCINPVYLANVDLTSSQIKVLMSFSEMKSYTMTELSRLHFVSISTMTSMVDRLIQSRLLQRQQDTADRRVVRISLTKEGEKILQHLIKVRKQELEKFFQSLGEGEKEQFVQAIENVAHYLSTAKGNSVHP